MKEKEFLMIPGPTPVPESVLLTLAKHPIGHRSKEFSKIFMSATEKLQWLAQTRNQVFIYTASGTGAMEGAISNLVNRGDKVLSLVIGVFGQRLADIATIYGADTTTIKVQSGQAISPEQLQEALSKNQYKVVTITHSETSTGTANNLEVLVPIIKASGALVIVDAVTSLGSMELNMDALGIDVLISGSQKGFMLPPGLSFIYVSEAAMQAKESCTSPSYYFCWKQASKALKDNTTPYTPNVSLIIALEHALTMMQEEGLENIWARHKRLRDRVRNYCREELNLKLLTEDDTASSAITAIYPPDGITVPELRSKLKSDWGIVVANGQKELENKIFRIGHLGFVCDRDIEMCLAALTRVLKDRQ